VTRLSRNCARFRTPRPASPVASARRTGHLGGSTRMRLGALTEVDGGTLAQSCIPGRTSSGGFVPARSCAISAGTHQHGGPCSLKFPRVPTVIQVPGVTIPMRGSRVFLDSGLAAMPRGFWSRCVAGAEADFSHAGTISTGAYGVDAASMLQERHELGIHAVWASPRAGPPVTGVHRERRENQERGWARDRPPIINSG
jgi:hypothetical protein